MQALVDREGILDRSTEYTLYPTSTQIDNRQLNLPLHELLPASARPLHVPSSPLACVDTPQRANEDNQLNCPCVCLLAVVLSTLVLPLSIAQLWAAVQASPAHKGNIG